MKSKYPCLVFLFAVMTILPQAVWPAAKKTATMAELALYKGADRQQILEEGAKKEGTLTFYTSGIIKQAVRPVVDAFEKRYPFIKVEIWRATGTELMQRSIEEFKSGKHLFDAMESTQITMVVLQELEMMQPFFVPSLAQIEDEGKTNAPGGGVYAIAFRSSGVGVGYNTKLIGKDQLPKTYQDLLDPKWKGKMAIVGSDTGSNWAGCVLNNFGEELLRKIAQQEFRLHLVSASSLLDMIINGEYAASPTIFDSHVVGSKKRGAPVAWLPLEPVHVNLGQIGLARHAPHPHAALLFAEFEVSKESAEIHKGVGYDAFRKDVAPLAQPYKKYFGRNRMADVKAELELFNRLFVKR